MKKSKIKFNQIRPSRVTFVLDGCICETMEELSRAFYSIVMKRLDVSRDKEFDISRIEFCVHRSPVDGEIAFDFIPTDNLI